MAGSAVIQWDICFAQRTFPLSSSENILCKSSILIYNTGMKTTLVILMLAVSVFAQDELVQNKCGHVAQTSRNASYSSDDAPETIPGLTHTVESGAYLFRAVIPATGSIGGLQIRIGGTSTDAYFLAQYTGRSVSGEVIQAGRAISRVTTLHITGATAFDVVIEGTVEIKNGGTFGIMAAQSIPHPSPSTVLRGAYLSITKINLSDPAGGSLDGDAVKPL